MFDPDTINPFERKGLEEKTCMIPSVKEFLRRHFSFLIYLVE